MPSVPRGPALAILALVSASTVAAEVLITRALSVTTWYGLAFVVLSLAMLGLTRGSLDADAAARAGEPMGPWIARRLFTLALGLALCVAVLVSVPLSFSLNLSSLAALLVVSGAAAVPLVAGGAVVARLLSESDVPTPTLYAVDLGAAALGALAPLVLLGPFGAPDALVLLASLSAAAAAWMAAPGDGLRGRAAALAVASLVVALGARGSESGLVFRFAKGFPRLEHEVPAFDAWTPLAYVRLGAFRPVPYTHLWSPSPNTPPGWVEAADATLDGEAATPVYSWRTPAQLNILRFDATTSAHVLRPTGTACVIGVGGGRDLIAALAVGHDRVLGAEINPGIVAMLHAVRGRSPTLDDPRVTVRLGDGRSLYARSNVHCSVLQASLVDTWAATSAGAFAHTEATLYTREAWSIFLQRVAPDGVLTFSRWYAPQYVSETARLVALAVASLHDRGITRPRDHIALVAAGNVATILVSPQPFSEADVAALHDLETRLRFTLLLVPGQPAREPLLGSILDARDDAALAAVGRPLGLDTTAPTDERPFFFQLLSPRAWLHPMLALSLARGSAGVIAGNATAMFELLATFAVVLLVAGWLLGPALLRAAKDPARPSGRALVYFAALGAGYMTAELALVQRLHVVLGHPTYALIVALAGLLVATGAGALLSARVLATPRRVAFAAVGAAVLLTALPYAVLRPLAHATLVGAPALRFGGSAACAAVVGLVLGLFFPAGLRALPRRDGAALALAVNGASSVLGSVLATTLSVWFGIPTTFAAAGAIYLVAAWAAPDRWRR